MLPLFSYILQHMKSIEAENEELKKQLFQSKQKSSKYAFDDEPRCIMKITKNHNCTGMHTCTTDFFFIDNVACVQSDCSISTDRRNVLLLYYIWYTQIESHLHVPVAESAT